MAKAMSALGLRAEIASPRLELAHPRMLKVRTKEPKVPFKFVFLCSTYANVDDTKASMGERED